MKLSEKIKRLLLDRRTSSDVAKVLGVPRGAVEAVRRDLKIPPNTNRERSRVPTREEIPDLPAINENDFKYIMETREGAEAIWEARLKGRRFGA